MGLYTLTDSDRARLRDLEEATKDDHFYGAWGGGKKSSGGGPLHDAAEVGADRLGAIIRGRSDDETIGVFDHDGKLLFSRRQDGTSVDLSDVKSGTWKGEVAVHNHPRGYGFPAGDPRAGGNSFSPDDLRLAADQQVLEMRVVSPAYDFIMRPGRTGWPTGAAMHAYTVGQSTMVRLDFTRAIEKGTMTVAQAEANHHHEVNKRLAKELGLHYERRPAKKPPAHVPPASWKPGDAWLQEAAAKKPTKGLDLEPDPSYADVKVKAKAKEAWYRLSPDDHAILEGKDDHFYGAWKGGKASAGGGPADPGSWDDKLEPEVAAAVTDYTDSGFIPVNGYLREDFGLGAPSWASPAEKAAAKAKDKAKAEAEGVDKQVALLRRAVRPTDKALTLYRGTTPDSFGLRNNLTPAQMLTSIQPLVGSTLADKGFTSTAISTNNLFWGGSTVRVHLTAPAGTRAINVDNLAKFPGEREVILAPGVNWRMTSAKAMPASTMGGMKSPAHLLIEGEVIP